MPALTIYKASAGAGKTFRLVVEYVKLLIVNPENYRHILAVTFTKKATKEMKMRILTQLYGIWKGLPSSRAYLETIARELSGGGGKSGKNEGFEGFEGFEFSRISHNAGVALRLILNDYTRFRIETIDSFFQSVLRNMTKELDINFNMRVELNGEQVKDKAIDQMIDNLEAKDTDFRRIVEFAEENMNEGKNWNIVADLKRFGKNIFTDFYQSHAADYKQRLQANPNLFKEHKKRVAEMLKSQEEAVTLLARQLKEAVAQTGMDVGIFKNSNKSGLGKYISYIEGGEYCKIPATIYKYIDSEDEWLKKSDMTGGNMAAVSGVLMPLLQKVVGIHEKAIRHMTTCRLSLRHLNNLELLASIERAVDKDNEAANRFLLSSTNQLLADMIGESDASFIFEKTGTQIHHLMIDEFQDTSTVQWQNFKKLLLECMSYYNEEEAQGTIGSMIVGDVKQSIYRWRGGDWNLLNQIDREFAPANAGSSQTASAGSSQTTNALIEIRNLDTNFRSDRNIVDFNNAFFLKAKEVCGIAGAYDDVAQLVPEGKEAEGEIQFFMLEKDDYEQRYPLICREAKRLIDSGVHPKDIAILAREKKPLNAIAKLFSEEYPEIHVVSKESFQLNASEAVNIIICALKLLDKPGDKILQATLLKKVRDLRDLKDLKDPNDLSDPKDLNDLKDLKALSDPKAPQKSSFLETVETIYRELQLDRLTDDGAFISTFFDFVKDFSANNTATLRNFLKHWEETLQEKTIESEAADGIQLMTIHKSKGLEFQNVIIADGSWNQSVSKNNIWVETTVPPFNDIPFNIFRASKELGESIYEEEYKDECYQNVVDNLNLLYVAFTRAGKRLLFFGQKSKAEGQKSKAEGQKSKAEVSVVERCLNSIEGGTVEELEDIAGDKYCFGKKGGCLESRSPENHEATGTESHEATRTESHETTRTENHETQQPESLNVFEMPVSPVNVEIKANKMGGKFRQSNRSKDFINQESASPYLETGLIMHSALSQIETLADVEKVLQRLEFEGVISDRKMKSLIEKRLSDEKVMEWFAPRWTVYNECSILTKDGEKRPDRVITDGKETIVIDFKFGNEKPEHHQQVSEYKRLLEEIGLPNVSARLWYVYNNKIVNV